MRLSEAEFQIYCGGAFAGTSFQRSTIIDGTERYMLQAMARDRQIFPVKVLPEPFHGLVASLLANTATVDKLFNGTDNTLAPCNDTMREVVMAAGPFKVTAVATAHL